MTDKLTKTFKVGLPALQRRVADAATQSKANGLDIASMPNRITLLLDTSGSMGCAEQVGVGVQAQSKSRIELLKDAVLGFVNSCNFDDTSVSIRTFPETINVPAMRDASMLTFSIMGLQSSGGTPMGRGLEATLLGDSLTRCVVVSDGGATDNPLSDDAALKFKAAGILIDTVSIGLDEDGEALLQRLAEITGGLYIKFKDVSSFANSFKYLAPALRGVLTDGSVNIGADEVRK